MKINISTSPDQENWDRFVLSHPAGSLLQSWAWGEFQSALGNKIWRLQILDEQQVVAQMLVIKLSLGFGKSLLYAPRDLLFNKLTPAHQQYEASKALVEKIKEIAQTEAAILFRVEPPISIGDATAIAIYKSFGFIPSKKNIQPKRNAVLDITPNEESLLANMKPKTRYNIKVAEKHNIKVVISKDIKDIDIFNRLNLETSSRNNFKSYSNNYYQKQLETLGQSGLMSLLIAYDGATPLAAILVSFFNKSATYLHGASSRRSGEKMASYILQWEAIKLVKSKGCATYNFGGVVDKQHPGWLGITRFKEGFGTHPTEYIGALELPLNTVWFKAYRLINKLRSI
ncbi:peptidoglycan bridge formation glycyltransferase FemA/FemB family protein [Patescibacteria group bacterium]|nr:peptidoglycan bridge formation glycyltransferase FemA/FemB family protein [Patescibacteria group bacterium]